MLTRQFITAASLESITSVVTISSGAALREPLDSYGSLKLEEENQARLLAKTGRAVVVGRAWSMSGPFVTRPRAYAISDFVLQARSGTMTITADHLVYRRYSAVSHFLLVCLRHATAGSSRTIDSGGELVEMGELAERVSRVVNPAATVVRSALSGVVPSRYASDGVSWQSACVDLGLEPANLEEQIRAIALRVGLKRTD